jgi:hypothetical protein
MVQLARRFAELKAKKETLEEELDAVKMEMSQVSSELIPELQKSEIQSLKIDGVGLIYLKTQFYARVMPEKNEEFISWLDNNNLGHLARRSVHHKTLTNEYQRWQDEDLPIPPEELVSSYNDTVVCLRRK